LSQTTLGIELFDIHASHAFLLLTVAKLSTLHNHVMQVLTTNCRRFLDLSLEAGMTCTFMIWIEPGRALWRAPMSRSAA